MKRDKELNPARERRFGSVTQCLSAISRQPSQEVWGDLEMSFFSGEDGVFTNYTPMRINGLQFFAQIVRHSGPDCQTLLSSNLSYADKSEVQTK
jgi:hypothetical protein